MPDSGTGHTNAEAASEFASADLPVRAACENDAGAIAEVLAQGFATLFRQMWGALPPGTAEALVRECLKSGLLSLHSTRVCEQDGRIVGVAVHVYGAVPPLAASVTLNGSSTSPFNVAGVVMVIGDVPEGSN